MPSILGSTKSAGLNRPSYLGVSLALESPGAISLTRMSVGTEVWPESLGNSNRRIAVPGRASPGTRTGPW